MCILCTHVVHHNVSGSFSTVSLCILLMKTIWAGDIPYFLWVFTPLSDIPYFFITLLLPARPTDSSIFNIKQTRPHLQLLRFSVPNRLRCRGRPTKGFVWRYDVSLPHRLRVFLVREIYKRQVGKQGGGSGGSSTPAAKTGPPFGSTDSNL